MAHRFFVPPESIAGRTVNFDRATAHQLRHVLRLRPGAWVVVLDNTGVAYDVEIQSLGRDLAVGRVADRHAVETEPRCALTLYQGLIKGSRFEWVLQKGTELGAARFVPLHSQRTVARDDASSETKHARWERIIREAAEQSQRGRLPVLSPAMPLARACEESVREHDLALLAWEDAAEAGLGDVLRAAPAKPERIALLVGPEGGFAPEEVAHARACGVRVVTLGPRILRAETAALAAAAIALHVLGEMG